MKTILCRYAIVQMLVVASLVYDDYRIERYTIDGGSDACDSRPHEIVGRTGFIDRSVEGVGL